MRVLRSPRSRAVSIAVAVGLFATPAVAQIDINPPLPNVLLLVDSSGSMEYMADGTLPNAGSNVCQPTNASSALNRWGTLLTVLTGTVQGRGCYEMGRNSSAFKLEYRLNGVDPYDASYFLPHFRLVSNQCVVGPGAVPSNAYDWPSNALNYHLYNSASTSCSGSNVFQQADDGLLDVYRDQVRFGLMTFDARANAGTGLAGNNVDVNTGFQGQWSYYKGWNSGGTPNKGNPPSCAIHNFEAGARNAAAPPWEGRMIAMGPGDATLTQIRARNARVQETLLAMRPYGATPLAGLLADAKVFFHEDDSQDPLDSSKFFAPYKDPYFNGGCRNTSIILLSDGEPNMDLRPWCETGNGQCPYQKAHEIAHELADHSDPKLRVNTYTVGFGLSQAAGYDCSTLQMPQAFNGGGVCVAATGALRACCTLARIAYEGGTTRAYFADDMATLKGVLSTVLSNIASGSTSRTMPVFAVATNTSAMGGSGDASYEFTSSFTPSGSSLWEGNLERHRWVCSSTNNGPLTATLKPVDATKGDDFVKNLHRRGGSSPWRMFYTVLGDVAGNNIHSERTIRPHLPNAVSDGLGDYKGTTVSGTAGALANIVKNSPKAMGVDPQPAMCQQSNMNANNATQCAKQLMRWELGFGTGTGFPTRRLKEFGAIYHSTPAVKGPPNEYLRDPSYAVFAEAQAKRPLMLYTATVDGQLHAFKVASNDPAETTVLVQTKENNELWAFLPPAVLKNIKGQYEKTPQVLLDGKPVVRDVPIKRDLADAKAGGTNSGAQWRTVLVAGGRGGGGFYYALDVTDPYNPSFLWQISTNASGEPLFGSVSGTPAIAIVNIEGVQEAVAILPGGASPLASGACSGVNRYKTVFPHIPGAYSPRSKVRCWQDGPGRSLTVVRISTGEIVMNFRRKHTADGPTLPDAKRRIVALDSPLTGVPVPYPSKTGQVADRMYIGDADGAMWRIDLSNPNPKGWNVDLMFDAYSRTGDTYAHSQPIETEPSVSVDGVGNTVLLFATGGQEVVTTSTGMKTRLWSITDIPLAATANATTSPFSVSVNWYLDFLNGTRVTGPLALFNKVAYFSTFTPQLATSGATCTDGYGTLWGVDYRVSGTTPQPLPGHIQSVLAPKPGLYTAPSGGNLVRYINQPAGTIVYGVGIRQKPSCFSATSVNDSFAGSHATISQSSAAGYSLVYQTGTGGTTSGSAKTKTQSLVLPTPPAKTEIDSWALATD